MYLGLKVGWTFGAGIFGAIFSFAIIKPLSTRLTPAWGGGYFGPKENVTAQSAATTSGGLFSGFISAVPALYKLGLMTTPRQDVAALTLFTISAAFYGLFFAVPLRRHFVVKQNLTFPTPRASATTIVSLHNSQKGEREAMKKAKWMAIWFVATFVWGIIAYFVPFFDTCKKKKTTLQTHSLHVSQLSHFSTYSVVDRLRCTVPKYDECRCNLDVAPEIRFPVLWCWTDQLGCNRATVLVHDNICLRYSGSYTCEQRLLCQSIRILGSR